MGAAALDYRNKLEKFLDENKVNRSAAASQTTLEKLKTIFKEYWDASAKWAEFANEESISDWEGSEYKGALSLNSKGYIISTDGNGNSSRDLGITNPMNGKVLFSNSLTNYGLAATFIHEMVHSIDVMSGVQKFWSTFTIGHDYIEARAYMETAKWQGTVFSPTGQDHILRAMPVILSTYNYIR